VQSPGTRILAGPSWLTRLPGVDQAVPYRTRDDALDAVGELIEA
jgi:hypothetical protein